MKEKELLARVAAMAQSKRLLFHHCLDSRECQGPPGFPDLVIAGPGGVLFIELKSEDGDTSAEQDNWLWILDRNQNGYRIFRPSQLFDGTISRQLDKLTGTA
jgi:hypothetical protein